MHAHALACAGGIELLAQQAVGTHTTRHHHALQPGLAQGLQRFLHQHLDDGRLGAGRQVGLACLQLVAQLARLGEHGGLQPGEGKIQVTAVQQRARQGECSRVALLRQARQRRPARITQAHELGRFVKGLARRVVNGLAQQRVLAHTVHAHQLRVSTGHQQRDEREFRRVRAEEGRQQMPLQVVHAKHGFVQGRAQRTAHACTHQQRPGQARPAREGNDIDRVQRAPGLGEHRLGQR